MCLCQGRWSWARDGDQESHHNKRIVYIFYKRQTLWSLWFVLFAYVWRETKKGWGREEENRWPNLTPEVLFMKQCLDSNCLFQPPRQTLLFLLCFSLSLGLRGKGKIFYLISFCFVFICWIFVLEKKWIRIKNI